MNSFLDGILYSVDSERFCQIRSAANSFAVNYVGNNIIQDDIFSLIENYARTKEMPLEWIRIPIEDEELLTCCGVVISWAFAFICSASTGINGFLGTSSFGSSLLTSP